MKQIHYRDFLRDVSATLENNLPDIDYCIFYGTLLGFHRGGDVIPWDNDVDFIWPIKYKKELIDLIESPERHSGREFGHIPKRVRRARIKRQAGEPSIVTIKRYVPGCTKTSNLGGKRYGWRRCRTSLDFYLYTESEDKIELAADAWKKKGTDWKSQHSLHSKENIFPIQKATMQDFSVKVPNLPAEVLNQLYGDNYMTFDEDFHSG